MSVDAPVESSVPVLVAQQVAPTPQEFKTREVKVPTALATTGPVFEHPWKPEYENPIVAVHNPWSPDKPFPNMKFET